MAGRKSIEVEEKRKKITRTERHIHSEAVKIDASRVAAAFHIDFRQKGVAVVQHVQADFRRSLHVSESVLAEEEICASLPFPAQQAVYDNVQLLLDDSSGT